MSGLVTQPSAALTTHDPTEAAPSEQVPTANEMLKTTTLPKEEAKSDKVTAVLIVAVVALFWLVM